MKKYELTDETMEINGVVLHRIRAVRDFGDIVAGTYGGWIEGESNLSHDGNAWVSGNAKVYGNAEVSGNAKVYGNAEVSGNAKVYGDADVYSLSHVLVIGPVGSRSCFTTFYRSRDNQIAVKCGCFCGTVEEFLEKVKDTHGNSKHALVYKAAAELAKLQVLG